MAAERRRGSERRGSERRVCCAPQFRLDRQPGDKLYHRLEPVWPEVSLILLSLVRICAPGVWRGGAGSSECRNESDVGRACSLDPGSDPSGSDASILLPYLRASMTFLPTDQPRNDLNPFSLCPQLHRLQAGGVCARPASAVLQAQQLLELRPAAQHLCAASTRALAVLHAVASAPCC